jgi:hypothetical protein
MEAFGDSCCHLFNIYAERFSETPDYFIVTAVTIFNVVWKNILGHVEASL